MFQYVDEIAQGVVGIDVFEKGFVVGFDVFPGSFEDDLDTVARQAFECFRFLECLEFFFGGVDADFDVAVGHGVDVRDVFDRGVHDFFPSQKKIYFFKVVWRVDDETHRFLGRVFAVGDLHRGAGVVNIFLEPLIRVDVTRDDHGKVAFPDIAVFGSDGAHTTAAKFLVREDDVGILPFLPVVGAVEMERVERFDESSRRHERHEDDVHVDNRGCFDGVDDMDAAAAFERCHPMFFREKLGVVDVVMVSYENPRFGEGSEIGDPVDSHVESGGMKSFVVVQNVSENDDGVGFA